MKTLFQIIGFPFRLAIVGVVFTIGIVVALFVPEILNDFGGAWDWAVTGR